ncbi:sugar transferase [Alphaproteobacteria bacterium]|nr:sugar transferase [Alphaproteobacteria bacterium]
MTFLSNKKKQDFFIRLLDLFVSIIGIIILAPVLLISVLFIIFLDRDYPFFLQKRIGKDEIEFVIYKLKTMRNSKTGIVLQAHQEVGRTTKIGKFLRKYYIDEIPQLFNVIKGEMSIVGPRPYELSHYEEYKSKISGFYKRSRLKPGLTGLAQIKRLSGPIIDLRFLRRRTLLDLFWIKKKSINLYIYIILKTLIMLIKR